MTRIILTEPLSSELGGATQPVEILNAAGSPIGHFVPIMSLEEQDGCPYSPEELAKMRVERGGRTLDEIWKSLGVK